MAARSVQLPAPSSHTPSPGFASTASTVESTTKVPVPVSPLPGADTGVAVGLGVDVGPGVGVASGVVVFGGSPLMELFVITSVPGSRGKL